MHVRRAGDPLGKLTTVARRWAGGRGGVGSAKDALTDAGAAAIAAIEARRRGTMSGDGEVELGTDEADAVRLFLALALQWRFHGFSGQRLGLEYNAVPPTAAMLGLTMTPTMFHDLRTMESAAVAVFASAAR